MQDREINCNGLEIPSEYDRDPNIGDTIPTSLHYRLDQSNQNIFQPQEWVAYKPTEQEEKYIFVQISHPVRLKDPSGKPLHPMNIEYVIFTSEEDTEGRTVKAFDLYKFIRGEKAPDDVPPDESESQELGIRELCGNNQGYNYTCVLCTQSRRQGVAVASMLSTTLRGRY